MWKMSSLKSRRRSSGSSLPFTDGGAEALSGGATSLQEGRRQCGHVGRPCPALANRKWESEILSKKEKSEKWLFSFQHPRWIPLLSHNNFLKILSPATLGSQLHHLSPPPKSHTLQGASQYSQGMGAAWEWGPVAICHPLLLLAHESLIHLAEL